MGPTVATKRRHAQTILVALVALLLISGCSSERLSQRTHYSAAAPTVTVTRTVPSPPRVVVRVAHRPAPPAVTIEQVHQLKKQQKKPAASTAKKPAAPVVVSAPSPHVAPTHQQASATPTAGIVTASDVEHETAGDSQARTTVISFHRLLNDHNGDACALLTPNFLVTQYKTDAATAMSQCRSGVEGLTMTVSVIVEDSGIDSRGRWVQVLSTMDGKDYRQTMRLAKVNGSWLIDSVEAAQS